MKWTTYVGAKEDGGAVAIGEGGEEAMAANVCGDLEVGGELVEAVGD